MSKEVNIDIGGGREAEFFVGLAAKDRTNLYVVLDIDEFRCPYTNLFTSLSLIKWGIGRTKEGNTWELPFPDASVDRAYLNNIYGVMDEINPAGLVLSGSKFRDDEITYARLLSSLKKVIKPSGTIHVQEAQGNLRILKQVYLEQGFKIIDCPSIVPTSDLTPTSLFLLGLADIDAQTYKRGLHKSVYLPMQFTASLV